MIRGARIRVTISRQMINRTIVSFFYLSMSVGFPSIWARGTKSLKSRVNPVCTVHCIDNLNAT